MSSFSKDDADLNSVTKDAFMLESGSGGAGSAHQIIKGDQTHSKNNFTATGHQETTFEFSANSQDEGDEQSAYTGNMSKRQTDSKNLLD